MSLLVMNKVWGLDPQHLTTAQRLLLLAIADSADDDGACFPHEKYLSWKTGMAIRTVQHHLSALRDAHWLTTERRRNGRHLAGNEYYIDVEELDRYQIERPVSTRKNLRITTCKNLRVDKAQELAHHDTQELAPHSNHQRSHQVFDPTTTTPPPLTNKFAGTCFLCDHHVEAAKGRLIGKKPAHLEGACGNQRTSEFDRDEDYI